MSDEDRVARLLQKAETYLEILHPAIYLRNREVKELRRSVAGEGYGRHRA